MKSWIVCAVLLLTLLESSAAESSPAEFLNRVRRTNPVSTYAMLEGTLQHRRNNRSGVISCHIYFGVILQKERTTGQLILNGNEAYLIGQSRTSGSTMQRMPGSAATDILGDAGVKATDLTMSFIHWKLIRELPERTLAAGMIPCRLFDLRSPDGGETVRVWVSSSHAFPIKAEFFRKGEEKPFRTLETGGFTKKNDLYYVSKIRLEGPGWRTRIDFEPSRCQLGFFEAASAPRIIRPLN